MSEYSVGHFIVP